MRKLICLSLILIISVSACSKKNETKTPTNTISIGGDNYNTIVIGTQTWTATNYNGTGGVGGFYTFAQATAINLPAGWRLPTQKDFNNLLKLAGGTLDSYGNVDNANALALMSATGWSGGNGTNSLGFNALSIGYGIYPGPAYVGSGIYAAFWSSSFLVAGEPFDLIIQHIDSYPASVVLDNGLNPDDYASIRFVKDN